MPSEINEILKQAKLDIDKDYKRTINSLNEIDKRYKTLEKVKDENFNFSNLDSAYNYFYSTDNREFRKLIIAKLNCFFRNFFTEDVYVSVGCSYGSTMSFCYGWDIQLNIEYQSNSTWSRSEILINLDKNIFSIKFPQKPEPPEKTELVVSGYEYINNPNFSNFRKFMKGENFKDTFLNYLFAFFKRKEFKDIKDVCIETMDDYYSQLDSHKKLCEEIDKKVDFYTNANQNMISALIENGFNQVDFTDECI